jgi:AsmA protein
MTSRNRPPPGGPPPFETYRPAEEHGGRPGAPAAPGPTGQSGQAAPRQGQGAVQYQRRLPPQQGYPQQSGYPQQRPLPPRPGPGRGVSASHAASRLRPVLVYGLLGVAALLAGALAFTLTALPVGFVRDRVVAAVKEKTGRDLVIAGTASFTLFPSLTVTLPEVSLSGAPGFQGARPLVTMRSLDLSVALLPLLRREVRVRTLVLRDPVFNLEIDGSGNKSWEFAATDGEPRRVRLAQADAPASGATASDAPLFSTSPPPRRRPLRARSTVRSASAT